MYILYYIVFIIKLEYLNWTRVQMQLCKCRIKGFLLDIFCQMNKQSGQKKISGLEYTVLVNIHYKINIYMYLFINIYFSIPSKESTWYVHIYKCQDLFCSWSSQARSSVFFTKSLGDRMLKLNK